MYFKFFSLKIIFSLSNQPINNNISILESKIIYFCLRSNFRDRTTLRQLSCQKSVSGKRSFSMISRLVIISSAVSQVRKDTLFNKKNCLITKNNILIMFFVMGYFLIIALYQFFKNDAILINHGSFFQEKDSLHLNRFQFLKMNQLLSNSAICL